MSAGTYRFSMMGSSPLARGLHRDGVIVFPVHRIIPARAGFTAALILPTNAVTDHPRSRGVYSMACGSWEYFLGSSPLARGLPRRPWACACGSPDHPRSRGVYPCRSASTSAAPGSSPLARGLLKTLRETVGRHRIIPARAGFTTSIPRNASWRRDHPRSRGVYPLWNMGACRRGGSSPLARGLRILFSFLVSGS